MPSAGEIEDYKVVQCALLKLSFSIANYNVSGPPNQRDLLLGAQSTTGAARCSASVGSAIIPGPVHQGEQGGIQRVVFHTHPVAIRPPGQCAQSAALSEKLPARLANEYAQWSVAKARTASGAALFQWHSQQW